MEDRGDQPAILLKHLSPAIHRTSRAAFLPVAVLLTLDDATGIGALDDAAAAGAAAAAFGGCDCKLVHDLSDLLYDSATMHGLPISRLTG